MKRKHEWRIWHTFKDGTTIAPGEKFPHRPEAAECFRQAMSIVDRALADRAKEASHVQCV